MMRRFRDMLIYLAAAAGVAAPAMIIGIAAATTLLRSPDIALASPQAVIRDCAQDGKLDHHYSLSDLKKAEKKLPADVNEYTNCADVINAAEVAGSGGKGRGIHGAALGGNGSGGGGSATPGDTRALARATHSSGPPSLTLHGQKVTPGSGGVFKTAGAANTMPVPVLLALIAVAALTAAGGFVALRRRYPAALGAVAGGFQTVRRRVPEVVGAALRIFRR